MKNKRLSLGIDIGGTSIKMALVDEEGGIGPKAKVMVEQGDSAEKTLLEVIERAKMVLDQADGEVVAIGLGCPGAINPKTGICDYSNNLGWKDVHVVSIFSKALGLPAFVDNDANAALLGEVYFGNGKDYRDIVFLTLGTGVGSGLYLNGKIYAGREGKGAELGHTVIEMGGRKCTCGREGCLEAYASATGLKNLIKEAMHEHPESLMWKECPEPENPQGHVPFKCEKLGDSAAKEVVSKYIHYLSVGCANFSNIFRPEAIIIGGGVSNQGKPFADRIKEETAKELAGYGPSSCPLPDFLVSTLGADAGIYGAAALGFEGIK